MQTPLILTIQLDETARCFFNQKRKQYFPPGRNFIDAHLTLFHHLPDEEDIINNIETVSSQQKRMALDITKPAGMGKGAAYKIESKELITFHHKLRNKWTDILTPQDRQGLWPHITIQNKVSAAEARQTLADIEKEFTPFTAYAEGLSLWRYLNGPWQWYRNFPFAG